MDLLITKSSPQSQQCSLSHLPMRRLQAPSRPTILLLRFYRGVSSSIRGCPLFYSEGLPSELHRPLPLSLSAARDRDKHTNPSPTLSTLSFAFFSEFATFAPNPFGLSRFIPSPFPKSAHLCASGYSEPGIRGYSKVKECQLYMP